jgi:hypothetical protein
MRMSYMLHAINVYRNQMRKRRNGRLGSRCEIDHFADRRLGGTSDNSSGAILHEQEISCLGTVTVHL